MKYLLVNSLFYPQQRGGAEQVVYTTAKYLASQGHQVDVISTQTDTNTVPYKVDKIDRITVYRLSKGNIASFDNLSATHPILRLFWHAWDIINPYNRWSVNAILAQLQPDVIWAHNLKGIGYVATRQFARQNAKFVWTLHDVQLYEPSGLLYLQPRNLLYRLFRTVYSWLVKFVIAQPDLIVSPSKWLIDFYNRRGFFQNCRNLVLENPTQLTPAEDIDNTLLHQRNQNPKLLFIGQLEYHKGVKFLVSAVQQYNQDYTPVNLTVAGDGHLASELSSMVASDKRIHLVPWNKSFDSTQYIQQFDLVVVPSLCYENSPTVIKLAHQAGLPVLAADIGGIPEMIQTDENGWLFLPGDKDDFIDNLNHIINIDLQSLQSNIKTSTMTVENYISNVVSEM